MRVLLRLVPAVALVAGLAACGSSHSGGSSAASPAPTKTLPPPIVDARSFGMHVLQLGAHPYPPLPFGTARVWDMGVTWKDLQPTSSTPLTGNGSPALARLDTIVSTFAAHHVQPMLTLGMTPDWAANNCPHVSHGQDWGLQTCAPKDTSETGPWGRYVKALATRYKDRVRYFETWNEPSLANGYNDSVAALARMQQTAYDVLHSLHFGQQLISPGIPFTNGPPTNAVGWLSTFFAQPGGTKLDIIGLHLYPADAPVRAGYGPEWSTTVALPLVRQMLAQHALSTRPIWNTETNVGRGPAHTGYQGSAAGAAAVARTFILGAQARVERTIWYAADDRTWGGTWLANPDFATLSTAGSGYVTVHRMLSGRAPLGCSQPTPGADGSVVGTFTCRFGTVSGKVNLVAAWTTAGSATMVAPTGTTGYYTVAGAHHTARAGASIALTGAPVYVAIG